MYSRNYPDSVPEIPVSSFYDDGAKQEFLNRHSHTDVEAENTCTSQKPDCENCTYYQNRAGNTLFKNIKVEDIIIGALILMSLNGANEDCDKMIPVLLLVLLLF